MSRVAVRLTMRGRRRAEALMVDQCEIRRPTSPSGVLGALVYAGKCKVQTYEPFEANPQSGQHTYTVQRYYLHVPAGTPNIRIDDVVTITATKLPSGATTGRSFRVAGLLHKSFNTAQRLLVDEITSRGV